MFFSAHSYWFNIVENLRHQVVACSASARQGTNPQEVLLAQFSLYEHKGDLKPHLFYFPPRFSHFFIVVMKINLTMCINRYDAEISSYKPWTPRVFQFEIIINVLVSFFRFIWISMLWVNCHYKYVYSYSAGIDFRFEIFFNSQGNTFHKHDKANFFLQNVLTIFFIEHLCDYVLNPYWRNDANY